MGRTAHITADDQWHLDEDKALVVTIYAQGSTEAAIVAGTATPQDISGWALSFMLKRRLSDLDAAALVTKTTGSGIALTTPASGVCTVTIADTDTTSLEPGLYWAELKRTDAGYESVLWSGRVDLLRGVHRA